MIAVFPFGNLRSLVNALRHLAIDHRVLMEPNEFAEADKLILPGVGHFGAYVTMLEPYRDVLDRFCKPVLGICAGMHVMAEGSEEAPGIGGLGWLKGTCRRVDGPRVPRMGWDEVHSRHPVVGNGVAYFAHSFTLGADVASGEARVLGVQFHPEKSQSFGLGVLKRFAEWQP